MEEANVTVTEVAENKRNKLVQMTDSGRERYEKIVRHITSAEDKAMSMLTQEQQQQLIDLSRTFTQNLTMLINNTKESKDGIL